ncbi:hypothetical protein AQ505_10215 [Pedobacter sp. PACM 27299]|uniref:hypothetical protein n=1 Tax=Pedobacter sp. PACM 27299 TaxID=1727164 RepID=UPI0007067F10|nr:hypothetical protein [Pedobacter sp. PACM 27299]ALL05834.1 hypothetical protein AQ505_10215 [Pedobacter sp. PACM 27299]
MKRRKFLLLTGLASGSILIPSALYFVSPGVKQFAALLIEREFKYLKLEPGSVTHYVDDYFAAGGNNIMANLRWKTMYYLNMNWEQSNLIFELIRTFLLSSDFFIHKTDETRVVRYIGLYSPYKSPVPNPFSYLLYPPDEIGEP